MLRQILLAGTAAAISLANTGCRSCNSYHDYSPPVAGCCDAYGTHRAGAASAGYIVGSSIEDDAVNDDMTHEMARMDNKRTGDGR